MASLRLLKQPKNICCRVFRVFFFTSIIVLMIMFSDYIRRSFFLQMSFLGSIGFDLQTALQCSCKLSQRFIVSIVKLPGKFGSIFSPVQYFYKSLEITSFDNIQRQSPGYVLQICSFIFKNVAKFTGKHLCRILLFY